MIIPKLQKVVFYLTTGYVLFLLGFSVWVYHAKHQMIVGFFTELGYPGYLVYPLAYLKLLVMVIIVSHRYNDLRDMAYAAYFINMMMALVGHVIYGDSYLHAAIGAACIVISYLLGNRVRGRPTKNLFGQFTEA
ncbi:MAG: hypothetical protein ACJAQ6_002055 [Arenicella sp.]|jgi:hypothetical protein